MAFRRAAQGAVKTTAAAVDIFRRRRLGVSVLLYHRVGGQAGIENDLPKPLFRAQVEELSARHCPVTIDAALSDLCGDEPPPSHDEVVLTFDDGTADFVDVTLPVLVAHGVPATLYVATDFIERQVPFPHGGTPLSWAALRDALATGLVTVGSHTHSHALLDRISPGQAADELDRSVGLIEDRLGIRPRDFAYPKALAGQAAVEHEVRRRFRSAALAGTRSNPYGRTDPIRLARSPVQRSDGMVWFRRKAAGGMVFEDALRRASWKLRYRGRTD